jgi:hypothetical protein
LQFAGKLENGRPSSQKTPQRQFEVARFDDTPPSRRRGRTTIKMAALYDEDLDESLVDQLREQREYEDGFNDEPLERVDSLSMGQQTDDLQSRCKDDSDACSCLECVADWNDIK